MTTPVEMIRLGCSAGPFGAAELWCPNIACGEQCEQRHPVTARLYHDHPLAPAEGEPSEPDDSGLGHCRADHPERLDRDRTIGMEIIRAVEIDGIDMPLDPEIKRLRKLSPAALADEAGALKAKPKPSRTKRSGAA